MKSYSIILVTYNRAQRLNAVLSALLAQTRVARKIIIINNNSDDDTERIIKGFTDERIIYLNTGANVGHGAGLAFGFEWYLNNEFRDEFLLFAEDDSEASKSLAESMIMQIEPTDYGLLVLDGLLHKLGRRYLPPIPEDTIVDVDFGLLDGAIMRSGVLKRVGLPVRDWFMMCDDMEYCTRIKKAGIKIGCVKNKYHTIFHLGANAGSSAQGAIWRAYYQTRNHVYYLQRHFSLFRLCDFLIIEFKRLYGALLVERYSLKTKLRLTGLMHGLRGIKGRSLNPKTLQFEKRK